MLDIRVTREPELSGAVVCAAGRFDGQGAAVFERETAPLFADASTPRWIVDMAGVEYLSSAGVRALVAAEKALRARKGCLILAALAPAVEFVLEATGLLEEFRRADNAAEARELIARLRASGESAAEKTIGSRRFAIQRGEGGASHLDIWGEWAGEAAKEAAPGSAEMIAANLEELGFAIGEGGFGGSREQAAEASGVLVTAGRCAAVAPEAGAPGAGGSGVASGASGAQSPDFIVTTRPRETVVYVRRALGISGAPAAFVDVRSSESFDLNALMADLMSLRGELGRAGAPILGVAALAATEDAHVADLFFIGLAGDAKALRAAPEDSPFRAARILEQAADAPASGGETFMRLQGIRLSPGSAFPRGGSPEAITAALKLESLSHAARLNPKSVHVTRAVILVYLPASARSSAQRRLKIQYPAGEKFRDEWEILTRRIFEKCSRVDLTPLHGGFSASTYHATGFDAQGRRLLPMVLKIGSLENVRREEEAWRRYVQDYILNNSTVILGSAAWGDWAAICYNFVGVSGPDSRLAWMRERAISRSAEELLPIFDRIFTDVLKPWYGQPRWERVCPYAEHTPSTILFPNLLDDARTEMNAPPDQKTIECPELGATLPNPYYALKHIFPARRDHAILWYSGINHGDLNLQNILIDERDNVFVIDFSETRTRNIVSDFARLEPVFLFELARVKTDEDIRHAAEFQAGLAEQKALGEAPPLRYSGNDPMIPKAHRLICRLREYAKTTVLFETNMVPYWLALLQWMLPVASYRGLPAPRKRLALISAALYTRNILEHDPEAKKIYEA